MGLRGGAKSPILYITTPDHPLHGGFTGSSGSSSLRELCFANERHPEDRRGRKKAWIAPGLSRWIGLGRAHRKINSSIYGIRRAK